MKHDDIQTGAIVGGEATEVVDFSHLLRKHGGDTPLQAEVRNQRMHATSTMADMINEARQNAEGMRRRREAYEAFRVTSNTQLRDEYAEREAARIRMIENLQAQISDIHRAGEKDADEMRARVRENDALCGEQVKACNTMIDAHENFVEHCTK